MSINLTIDIYIYLLSNARSLCGKQRSKQLHFVCSPRHYWRISHISLQRGFHTSRIKCKWARSEAYSYSKHCYFPRNHVSIWKRSTSAPKGLTKVTIRLSRIKSTLNSVSKAVFGSQNEMISRLAQFKPNFPILRKVSDSGWLKQKNTKQAITFLKKYSDRSTEKSPFAEEKSHLVDKADTEGVQALVGGYIGGLVPKLKCDSKSQSEEQEEPAKTEQAVSKDKNAEEKKHLSLQREKIIARVSIDNRTRALVQALRRTADPKLCITRVEELTFHLLEFPEGKGVAVKERIIPYLLRLRQVKDETLQAAVREILALIGYVDPVKGRGIRILTIDGGGTRGVVALQTLRKLVELTQKPVHQLFDYICGVSTGAVLAFMLGLFHMPLDECEELYRKLGSDVFSQNVIVGTVKMSWSHAFYDSQTWEKILKDRMGSALMIETARNPACPKVAAVSTIVNRGITPKAFVFRNYGHFPGINSHYLGGCQYKMWQAIRASSAAPGYFAEYALGNDLHQDGGLLLNNPSALAMHECKCLWPDVPLECIVSLGTGRYESDVKNTATYTSLKTKLSNVINSATDTEEVHIMLDGLLPPDTYFRFNPVMCENIPLDESRNEKLDQLQLEGLKYIERNEQKMKKLAKILSQEKTTLQKINDWIKLKTDMYEGLPFFSKL
ncbi:calcium-independent phospholipase A2-gamma isoform X5 [Heterocephalus glaber]|uniref:Calcium-independent phospholipase A2-gamma n=1 Tax=Heterocephalus glaber TaxID=10181 RepID=A0AAX6SNH6_HETGA|nr:calcium-independent phospholipase A2-gamma isoform X5 [Heterocephalus glaber]